MKKIITEPLGNWCGIGIVGEAPGEDEERYGKPFIGYIGQYLTKLLQAVGINRAECPITNTVHVRPYKNRYANLSAEDKREGLKELEKDIHSWADRGVRVVIAMGGHALAALCDAEGITKYRGSVLPCKFEPRIKVLPTFHPSHIRRGNNQMEPVILLDLKKGKSELQVEGIQYPKRDINISRSIPESKAMLADMRKVRDPLVIDIESNRNGKMTSYGMATSPTTAWVIPGQHLAQPSIMRKVSELAYDPLVPKIFHNCLFDCIHGYYYYHMLYKNIFCDTMLAQHAAFPVWPKSLAFCASIYTNEPYWKEEGRDFYGILSDSLFIYNGKDCCLTYEIYFKLMEELECAQTKHILDHSMALVEPCMFAMIHGIMADYDMSKILLKQNADAILVLDRMVEETIGPVNVRSHVQLKHLLYEQWKLPKQYMDGKLTTRANKLKNLLKYPTPYKSRLLIIMEQKKLLKMKNFLEIKDDTDGRIRTSLNIAGTYTGRFSSAKFLSKTGDNLFNQPKAARANYRADPGFIFLQMDLSQSEARFVAALCRDIEWLREFDEIDLHSKVASMLFNIPIEKVNKATHRQIAKKVAHGVHYLLGPQLMSETIGCNLAEARRLKDTYLKLRSKVRLWHREVEGRVRQDKKIITPYGRVIQFFGPVDDKVLREATAAEPQSTSAQYLNEGLIKIFNAGCKEFRFLLQVYDSILCMVPDDISVLRELIPLMKSSTEVELDVHGIPLVVPCEFEIGYNWGSPNKTNALGMHEIKGSLEETYAKLQTLRS